MSLQLPWHKGALPGAGRDPNLIEPVIYYWGSRKVASRGFALAHHPGFGAQSPGARPPV